MQALNVAQLEIKTVDRAETEHCCTCADTDNGHQAGVRRQRASMQVMTDHYIRADFAQFVQTANGFEANIFGTRAYQI